MEKVDGCKVLLVIVINLSLNMFMVILMYDASLLYFSFYKKYLFL